MGRPEALWGNRPEGGAVRVGGVKADGVAPPGHKVRRADRAILGVLEGEEDEDDRHGET